MRSTVLVLFPRATVALLAMIIAPSFAFAADDASLEASIANALTVKPRGIVDDTDVPVGVSPTPTASPTPIESATPTESPTPIESATPTESPTPVESATPTESPTPVETPTETASPTPTLTPTPLATATPRLDHFLCYAAQRRAINVSVAANDDVGDSTITVRQAKRLCAPGDDATAPSRPGHLTFYTIRQTSPSFERIRNLSIRDQFGTIEVDLIRPERLLVPTSKSLQEPPPPELANLLDHFKCYRVHGAHLRVPAVSVETQFGALTVAIKRPRDLCIPVDKDGGGILDPTTGLMCYQVRTLPQRPPHVYTTDQFGSDDYDLFGVRDLCVPLLEGPGTCGDGSLNSPGEQCETDGNDAACPGLCDKPTCRCPPPGCVDQGDPRCIRARR